MTKPTAIIIGAGLGGLSTGIYGQMNGYDCHIFEHGRHPGGVAAEWKRRGYTIDGGIHFYMGYKPGGPDHALYAELGVDQADQYEEMQTYGRFVDTAAGRTLDIGQDLDRLAATMKDISPQDAAVIDKIFTAAKAFRHTCLSDSMLKPPDMSHWWDTLIMMFKMRRTARYYSGWYMQPVENVAAQMKNRWLAHVFKHLFLPEVPLIFILVILGQLSSGDMAVRKDGSGGFARALENRYQQLGGTVTYRSTVEKILVEGNRAVGVRLANGDEHRADRVVSAADGFSTLYDLLDGQYLSQQLSDLHRDWPLFKPVVMLNYGVARDLSDEPSIIISKPTAPLTAGYLSSDCLITRIFNYSPNCAPAGKSLLQVMIDSKWEPWKKLRQDKTAYTAHKQETAHQVLQQLNQIWPGIEDQVEMTNVATPYTWWRYTRNRRGSYEGFAIIDKVFRTQVKRTLPGLGGFVMAGQWVIPGGGVIPTLLSGKHAAMLMCHQDGKPFQARAA